MSSISSITKAVSGLVTAQKGLQVTGHNISNMNTSGYTRQQLLQSESPYLNIGHTATNTMQVGLGVTCDEIRQIRDALADKRLRTEKSVLSYYQTLNTVTQDVESIFDEPYGDTISDFMNDFWSQAQKLSTSAGEVEERMSFISSAKVLMEKINDVSNSLTDYQYHINSDIETSVKRINEITAEIRILNDQISISEVNGDNANDYRDQRNLLLDELSEYGQISYYEEANGQIKVKFEGHQVVNGEFPINIEMEDIKGSPFSMPIWSDTKDKIVDLTEISSAANQNDSGKLKALLIARGENVVNSETSWNEVALNDNFSVDVYGNAYTIPKLQKMLNEFSNKLVSIVNESFTGMGIGTQLGKDGVQVFVPIKISDAKKTELDSKWKDVSTKKADVDRARVSLEEKQANLAAAKASNNPTDITNATNAVNAAQTALENAKQELNQAKTTYEAFQAKVMGPGNIQVNPLLLANGGHNYLGTITKALDNSSLNDDCKSDNSIIKDFLSEWKSNRSWFEGNEVTSPSRKTVNLNTFFTEVVTDFGADGKVYMDKASEKSKSVDNIENERASMGGVSMDEEFTYMLKYQYAYNASSRMITMLDGMLDTIINRM